MMKEINKYSNPKTVYKNAKQLYGNDVEIQLSSNPKKKYMIYDPYNEKWVHFGEYGYEDYTKHQDEERRERFLKRNAKWKNSKPYTSSFMSYYILW